MQCSFILKSNFGYSFSETHPFNQKRIVLTMDLLKKLGALQDSDIIAPRIATDNELFLAHDAKFIEIVKQAGDGKITDIVGEMYGIGTEDTPIFKICTKQVQWLSGGTLTAVDEVMEGRAKYALNLGGGLHHGFSGRASGFCVYNDSSVAIKYIQKKYGARVLSIEYRCSSRRWRPMEFL